MLRRPAVCLLALALATISAVALVMIFGQREPEPEGAGGAVALGQHHMLASLHSRRQPSWQLTWNAPDGAAGYTVYVGTFCPVPSCNKTGCVAPPDGSPCTGVCSDASVFIPDAGGICTCLNGAGQPTCLNSAITAGEIDAGGCSNPALCCVSYPGTPAPAGQHDGIIVSQCYRTYADGGAVVDGSLTPFYIQVGYFFDVESQR